MFLLGGVTLLNDLNLRSKIIDSYSLNESSTTYFDISTTKWIKTVDDVNYGYHKAHIDIFTSAYTPQYVDRSKEYLYK